MRSFREEYQKEMDRQGTFHLDAERVSDEIHHHKLRKARRRRAMASVASAAAVFLLLGGVATAMNYVLSKRTPEGRPGLRFPGLPRSVPGRDPRRRNRSAWRIRWK